MNIDIALLRICHESIFSLCRYMLLPGSAKLY